MEEDVIDANLNFFKTRSAIKGLSTLDKLKGLSQRWFKVIEDCEKSNDSSKYRFDFAEAHKLPLSILNRALKEADSLNEVEVAKLRKELVRKFLFFLKQQDTSRGTMDALSFIVCEIENC